MKISLKEYLDARLIDLDKRIEQARLSMEKRLDSMNEFRDSLRDQSEKSPTRIEVNAEFESIKKDIRILNSFKDQLSGVASQKEVSSVRIGVYISLAVALLGLLLRIFDA